MNKLRGIFLKCCGTIASLVLIVGISSTNIACVWWFYQPEVPKGMERFKR